MKTEQDLVGCLDKLNKLCRICLCENNEESKHWNPYWESIYEKVMSCMQIDFLTKDMLPCEICDLCCKELEVADKLRIKCENSNTVLKRIYQQYLVKDEQKQSNEMGRTLEDYLEMRNSDEEPLVSNQLPNECWDDSFEDNKDQVKDVIFHINLEGRVVNQKRSKKTMPKRSKKDEIVVKTENIVTNVDQIRDPLVQVKKKLFICDVCNKTLKNKLTIIRHITKQHSAEKMDQPTFKVTGLGADRRFHCPECPQTRTRKNDIKIHLRVHTGDKPYACDVCKRSFAQRASLACHRLTHSDTRQFTCQECGKQFKNQKVLKVHQTVHSKELFHCKLCSKGLKTQKALSNHMKRHSQIKNHSCELCGATFVTGAELIRHKYSHGNKKRLHCTQCDFSCLWRNSLELHIRRHRKDKTEQCDKCDYICYTKGELRTHRRKHSKEQIFPCPMCDEKFKQSKSVNRHMLSKHGQKFEWGKVADRRLIK